MQEMEPSIAAENIKRLRNALNLSEHYFAALLGISRSTVVNIENGGNIHSGILNKLREIFFMYTRDDIVEISLDIPNDLKERLSDHFKNKRPEYIAILEKKPQIAWVITKRLIPSGYFESYHETREIRDYIEDNYGWDYNGPAISQALNRMPDEIIAIPHEGKKNTFRYRARPKH